MMPLHKATNEGHDLADMIRSHRNETVRRALDEAEGSEAEGMMHYAGQLTEVADWLDYVAAEARQGRLLRIIPRPAIDG